METNQELHKGTGWKKQGESGSEESLTWLTAQSVTGWGCLPGPHGRGLYPGVKRTFLQAAVQGTPTQGPRGLTPLGSGTHALRDKHRAGMWLVIGWYGTVEGRVRDPWDSSFSFLDSVL